MADVEPIHPSSSGPHPSEEASALPDRTGKPLVRNPLSVEVSWRLMPPLLAGVAVVLLGEPTAWSLAAGLLLVAAGEGVRLWAAGHLYKTRELVTSGPYAWVRHPLYAGTLLVGCGFLVAASGAVTGVGIPLYLLFFFGYYLPYKTRKEDGRLLRRHPEYRRYRSEVPSLVPWRGRWDPTGPARRRRWSLAQVRDNDEVGTALLVASVALVFALDVVA